MKILYAFYGAESEIKKSTDFLIQQNNPNVFWLNSPSKTLLLEATYDNPKVTVIDFGLKNVPEEVLDELKILICIPTFDDFIRLYSVDIQFPSVYKE